MKQSNIKKINEIIKLFSSSPTCPYFLNDSDPDPVDIEFNGKTYSSFEIENISITAKRKANYDLSLDCLIYLIEACQEQNGKVNIWIIQDLYKVLIAINEFNSAYEMLVNVNIWFLKEPSSTKFKPYLENYPIILSKFCHETRNPNNINELVSYCKACSGNPYYSMPKNWDEISKDFKKISTYSDRLKKQKKEEEKRKKEEEAEKIREQQQIQRTKWKQSGLCQYCGGKIKGLFFKKCSICHKKKGYKI